MVALSTLPAVWTGAEPSRIAESLAASLFTMLDPELVYVSFILGDPSQRVAIAQTGRYDADQTLAEQIGPTVLDWSRSHDPDDLLWLELPGRSGGVRVATRQIGLNGELGVVAAAFAPAYCFRPNDMLVLNVAATQAAVAVQNTKLLHSLRASELRATQAAEELSRREAQFRNLAEALPNLCWMAYGDGHIFWYNSRWYEFTGTTPEQMEGWGWKTVHDPEILPEVMERWTASIRTGDNFEMVFPLRRADGAFRPFLTRVVPIRDESGRIVRWFGTNTDITGQKEIEKELRNANADLEQFAYSASHDLQEPLRSVAIFSQLLAARAREKLDGESLEYLDNVISGATRMEALLKDLLVYVRATRLEKPEEATDANSAIQIALANLKGAIAESAAKIDFEPLPTLPVHPTELELLFQNLISNAIKYRRPDVTPVVHVAVKKLNAQWLYSVSDNGIGIEAQYHERIFGLFKRLHTADTYSGSGIGLALCRRIVERHNGRMWVESKPGQGSTFYFTLPE
ncbi:MAG TPA: ATP-binding protein [Bryobacteraceae bacterium]|nr:ATP-binding protein [Bryobacteraceae bacterium]